MPFGSAARHDAAIAALNRRLDAQERLLAKLAGAAGIGAEDLREMQQTSPSASPEVRDALRAGDTIRAIKIYREQTGVGLVEAKRAVEEIASGL